MRIAPGAGLLATSSRSVRRGRLFRPTSLPEALALLAEEEQPPVLIAGGTDLAAQYNEGLDPAALLSLDRIEDLRTVDLVQDELRIGACVTHAIGSSHPLVVKHIPGFAEAWRHIANVRVRFWATIGGNVMARRTRYEMSILLTALDARLRFLAGGVLVERSPDDVWNGALPQRGILHHVAIPLRNARLFAYERSLRPIMTLALYIDEDATRAVVATEWLRPLTLMAPHREKRADEAAEKAFAALPESFGDVNTSAWYLRRVGAVLLRRQLEASAHV